jgi:uncharacterized protein
MAYKQDIINKTLGYVKHELSGSESGHDWWHAVRVRNTALKIAKTEKCNIFIVELSALLHDIADAKFNNGDENAGPSKAFAFMKSIGVEKNDAIHVINIIKNISFKGGNTEQSFKSAELDIVQDADRLDAIGAIGVARAFSYGGYKKREFYNPEINPAMNMTPEQYRNSTSPTINHFYEKLLLLKDRMNTKTGKILAEERHQFMLLYLEQFYKEWN